MGFIQSTVHRVSKAASAMFARSAHQAGDLHSQELANFQPRYVSADAGFLPERRTIQARIQDLARNDGWTSSTLQRYVDHGIGARFALSYKPDYVAMGIDIKAAAEFRKQVETAFRQYAYDPRFYVDAAETLNFAGLVGLAFRHRMRDGECLAVMQWMDRPWFKSRTAVQLISPERLSNPNDAVDTDVLRGGVERNTFGAPVAYHIRSTHPGDVFFGQSDQFKWERVLRRTPWGRPIVIHQFEPDEAGQTRGKSGLAAVVKKVFMANKYADAEMQAAFINAVLAAYIESPLDHEALADALDDGKNLDKFQASRLDFHGKSKFTLGGVKIPFLHPGEKIGVVDAARPNTAYAAFEERALRYFAAATGQAYEQLASDYSKTNYSSVRAAMLESFKYLSTRRDHFAAHFCTPIFAAWMEDAVSSGVVTLPVGAPKFWDAYAAYTRCDWIGPARGWVDPTKEIEASGMAIDINLSTLADEAAASGKDWRDVLEQRAYERAVMADLGLPDPTVNVITEKPISPSNEELDAADDEERNSADPETTSNERASVMA